MAVAACGYTDLALVISNFRRFKLFKVSAISPAPQLGTRLCPPVVLAISRLESWCIVYSHTMLNTPSLVRSLNVCGGWWMIQLKPWESASWPFWDLGWGIGPGEIGNLAVLAGASVIWKQVNSLGLGVVAELLDFAVTFQAKQLETKHASNRMPPLKRILGVLWLFLWHSFSQLSHQCVLEVGD